ncbi:MAG: hypothetical protein ACK4SM_06240 [Aquificaceae bacterium]
MEEKLGKYRSSPTGKEDVPHILLWGSVGGFLGLVLTLSFISEYHFKFLYLLYSFVAFSFASVAYVSAMEIYPSYIRACAIGIISIVGRAFGFSLPYVLVKRI